MMHPGGHLYGVFERVGSSRQVNINVRIIAATNANLPLLARGGKFMRDLLDRLSFEVLTIPPLRERGTDILLLAEHFAARMIVELKRSQIPILSDKVRSQLLAYHCRVMSGNARMLSNAPFINARKITSRKFILTLSVS